VHQQRAVSAALGLALLHASGVAHARAAGTDPPRDETAVDALSGRGDSRGSLQGRVSGFVGWGFNVPLGSVRDFSSVMSPLGFELQLQVWVLPALSVGVSGEWSTFVDNRPRTTYALDSGAITATAYNYMQSTSARLLAHYYFLGDAPLLPYVGPHVGITWVAFDSEAADLALTESQASIVLGAEAGVEVPFGRDAPVALLNVRYSVAPAAEFRDAVSNVQTLGMLIGIGF
jgi:hypothetical protein